MGSVESHIAAVERSVASLVRDGQPARAVVLARTCPTIRQDLWGALTDRERIGHWFLPIAGELRLGGRYQLEGNAGGVIEACVPPSHFAVTWEFGGGMSWLTAALSDAGGGTRLELTHTSPLTPHWDEYGPGAVGVGWDLGLMGLVQHLAEPQAPKVDETAFVTSPEGKAFIVESSQAWGQAATANGEAAADAHAAARRTRAFYTGEDA